MSKKKEQGSRGYTITWQSPRQEKQIWWPNSPSQTCFNAKAAAAQASSGADRALVSSCRSDGKRVGALGVLPSQSAKAAIVNDAATIIHQQHQYHESINWKNSITSLRTSGCTESLELLQWRHRQCPPTLELDIELAKHTMRGFNYKDIMKKRQLNLQV